jgi:hypothetical protein
MTDAAQLTQQMLAAKKAMDEAEVEHRKCVREMAEADRDFRSAHSTAYVAASGTEATREAIARKATATERYRLKMADGLERSALEAIRNARQFLSALQSLAAAQRAEAEFAKWESREMASA